MTTFLFWDIDGTLLTTERAGIFALEQAAHEVLGTAVDLAATPTAGLTDAEIALAIVCENGSGDPRTAARVLNRYAELLPDRLAWRNGRVLPNVREILEVLSRRDDVVSLLLTGNVERGAEAKLRHYGLWKFFGAGGAFSVEGADRPAIARQARELAAAHGGDGAWPPADRMVVIGDTPHDVSCGKAIDARTVAVATGPGYDLAALRACDPWLALEQLPAPAEFDRAVLAAPGP